VHYRSGEDNEFKKESGAEGRKRDGKESPETTTKNLEVSWVNVV
jgi:hypothetical protein